MPRRPATDRYATQACDRLGTRQPCNATRMAQPCHRHLLHTNMQQICDKHEANTRYPRTKHAICTHQACNSHATGETRDNYAMPHAWDSHAIGTQPPCNRCAIGMRHTCTKHATGMLRTCNKPAMGMRQTCDRHPTGMQ